MVWIKSVPLLSACKRTPINPNGLVLLFHSQLKQKGKLFPLSLSKIDPWAGGVFTVPVAKGVRRGGRLLVLSWFSWAASGRSTFAVSRRSGRQKSSSRTLIQSRQRVQVCSVWLKCDYTDTQIRTHTHTRHPPTPQAQACLHKTHSHTWMLMIGWMCSVGAVVPAAVVLLLNQFTHEPLELFARLLLLLEKLLHPLVLLQNMAQKCCVTVSAHKNG